MNRITYKMASPVKRFRWTWAALKAVRVDIYMEWFWETVNRNIWRPRWGLCRVEHLTTYSENLCDSGCSLALNIPVNTHNRSAILSKRIICIGCTGYCEPISGALCLRLLRVHQCNVRLTPVPTWLPVLVLPETEKDIGELLIVSALDVYTPVKYWRQASAAVRK